MAAKFTVGPFTPQKWEDLRRIVQEKLRLFAEQFNLHTGDETIHFPIIDDRDAGLVRWVDPYIIGADYLLNDMVRDGEWTMIANKDTDERAAPQAIGAAQFTYQGTIGESTDLAKQLIYGQRYTTTTAGYLDAYRVYTKMGNEYEVYWVSDPLGATPIFRTVETFTAQADGWVERAIEQALLLPGTQWDLVVRSTEPDPTPAVTSGTWDYETPQNITTPAPGVATQARSQADLIAFAYLDANAVDQETMLQNLAVGDRIVGPDFTWTIQAIDTADPLFITFNVSPVATATATNSFLFNFETVTPTPIPYGFDSGYWAANPNVIGLYIADGSYNDINQTTDQYGIDIKIQAVSISDDWDLVATSSGIVSSGGDTDSFVLRSGDTMLGHLAGLDPVAAQDFVTKNYGDANYLGGGGSGFVLKSGDTMTGNLIIQNEVEFPTVRVASVAQDAGMQMLTLIGLSVLQTTDGNGVNNVNMLSYNRAAGTHTLSAGVVGSSVNALVLDGGGSITVAAQISCSSKFLSSMANTSGIGIIDWNDSKLLGWASVTSTGSLETARSRGVLSTSRISTGQYQISTAGAAGSATAVVLCTVQSNAFIELACNARYAANDEIIARVFDTSSGVVANQAISLVFFS